MSFGMSVFLTLCCISVFLGYDYHYHRNEQWIKKIEKNKETKKDTRKEREKGKKQKEKIENTRCTRELWA